MKNETIALPGGLLFRHHKDSDCRGMFADLHSHNMFELIYIVSGDAAHVTEGRKYLLHPGDLVLVRPSKYHYLQILSDAAYERYNLLFDPVRHSLPEALELPEEAEVISLARNPAAAELFGKMDLYAATAAEDFEQLLYLLLKELFILLRVFPHAPKKEDILSPILSNALEYINSNLFTIKDVEEVAQALFISSSYLYQLFRQSLHQTPKKYINDKRLLAAQRMLISGKRPTAVSKECGFREYTTFFRCYCAFFGHGPSQDCGDK